MKNIELKTYVPVVAVSGDAVMVESRPGDDGECYYPKADADAKLNEFYVLMRRIVINLDEPPSAAGYNRIYEVLLEELKSNITTRTQPGTIDVASHAAHKDIYDLCQEIEKLPASEQQTKIVVMASAMHQQVDVFIKALEACRRYFQSNTAFDFATAHWLTLTALGEKLVAVEDVNE